MASAPSDATPQQASADQPTGDPGSDSATPQTPPPLPPNFPSEITTLDGQHLIKVKLIGIEADGINITDDSGGGLIPFTNLPPEIRKACGFDPGKAARAEDARKAQDLKEAQDFIAQQNALGAAQRQQTERATQDEAKEQAIQSAPKVRVVGLVEDAQPQGCLVRVTRFCKWQVFKEFISSK